MPCTIHFILGPPAAPRAARVLAAYREAAREPGSALFLVPTRRHADQVRASLGTCLAPLVFDPQSLADELVRVHEPAIRPHCATDQRLLIDSVLADLRPADVPDFARVIDTRGFVNAAAGYVAEVKEAGIELRQLLKTYPDEGEGKGTRHYQATRIFHRYHRRLAKQHRFDPVDRLGRAASLWSDRRRQPFDRVRSVFVAGFSSFTPGQEQLLSAIRATIDHFWIELPDGAGDEFAAPRALREELELSCARARPRREILSERIAERSPVPSRLIQGPGELGEARLIVRHIRTLLATGTRPERVLVVARHFTPGMIDLYREVFDEYGIPHDAEGADPLGHAPAVAFLLRAWGVADEGWEFAAVAAVLRSTYFRPNWPEVRTDPEVASKSEALLRLLGEARGREAFLKAVAAWEQLPPEPLEDEQPEEALRQRKQRLAPRCRPFLERFFRMWDGQRPGGSAEAIVARLRAFADELGLSRVLPADEVDLSRFWTALARWAAGDGTSSTRKLIRAERLNRVLAAIGSAPARLRSPRGGGVLLLSAERAAGLDCDYLVLIGLGEGSWPHLSAPGSLLDDSERIRLRKAGCALPDPALRLSSERLLFDTLATAPQRELILSYAAVDAKGQELLRSSFLQDWLAKSAVSHTTHQRMLLDGYFDQEPLSLAELRIQSAQTVVIGGPPSLDRELVDNLAGARVVAQARFRERAFTPYDGELRDPAVAAELAKRLGADKVFSATALENYIACPFRFLLQHVLRLELLEDPSEEVEFTRRGSAVHRALARFHKRVNEQLPEVLTAPELPPRLTDHLVEALKQAVEEYATRAPSRATAELWRLERERLERAVKRYRGHWHEFRSDWQAQNLLPAPHHFESGFGLPGKESAEPLVIAVDDVEVRIGGYIDRVDLVELEQTAGFWVIDYKTGRATSYSPSQVRRMEKLQLPLYALAVERVLLKDRPARPLGLAYWLVTDTGPKPMLPSGRAKNAGLAWLADADAWPVFRGQLEAWVARLVSHIRAGDFPLAPRSENCTETCDFGRVCRIAQSRNTGKVFALDLPPE